MTFESRNCQLLDNGSLKYVSVTKNRHAIIHELLAVRPEIKRRTCNLFESSFSRKIIQNAVQQFSAQLWSANQRTTETEEAMDS
jgi:hypothetical protein